MCGCTRKKPVDACPRTLNSLRMEAAFIHPVQKRAGKVFRACRVHKMCADHDHIAARADHPHGGLRALEERVHRAHANVVLDHHTLEPELLTQDPGEESARERRGLAWVN